MKLSYRWPEKVEYHNRCITHNSLSSQNGIAHVKCTIQNKELNPQHQHYSIVHNQQILHGGSYKGFCDFMLQLWRLDDTRNQDYSQYQ